MDYIPLTTVLNEEGKRRFGQFIRELRLDLDLKQKEFAKLLNVTQATISHWEQGRYSPNLDSICIIASMLGKNPESFVAFLFGRDIDGHRHIEEQLDNDEIDLSVLLRLHDKLGKSIHRKLANKNLIVSNTNDPTLSQIVEEKRTRLSKRNLKY